MKFTIVEEVTITRDYRVDADDAEAAVAAYFKRRAQRRWGKFFDEVQLHSYQVLEHVPGETPRKHPPVEVR